MIGLRYDHGLAAGAAAFAVVMLLWFTPKRDVVSEIYATLQLPQTSAPFEQASATPDGRLPACSWGSAASRTIAELDLFTPPIVLLEQRSDRFVLGSQVSVRRDAARFELELAAVVQEPFRLQLVGYVGDPAHCLGVFEATATGETVLARAGHVFSDLGLRVDAVEVRRERTDEGEQTPLTHWFAFATVVDLTTGDATSLTSLERHARGPLRARLRVRSTGELRDIAEAGELIVDDTRFRVSALRTAPPSVHVTRVTAAGVTDARTLTPGP
jgi:hypothetical protein